MTMCSNQGQAVADLMGRYRAGAAIAAALLASGCGALAVGPIEDTEACYALDVDESSTGESGNWPESTDECLPADEVNRADLSVESWCSSKIKSIEGEGTKRIAFDTGVPACCYPVRARDTQPNCIVGRPYVEGSGTRLARVVGEAASSQAKAWVEAARAEHASVAAFARLTLDLMALGAPLSLLAKVSRAGADEVKHAEICLQRAVQLGAIDPSLDRFPFAEPIIPRVDPVATAIACVREGCLGETVGACLAEIAAARSTDRQSRAVLEQLARDEARHAALSWEIVAWLIEIGGDRVRAAVTEAFQQRLDVHDARHLWAGAAPAPEAVDEMLADIHRTVLEPATRALLAA